MKLGALKEYREVIGNGREIIEYLKTDLARNLREIFTVLGKLDLVSNFRSFQTSVSIPAGAEVAIRNEFRDGTVPSKRLVVRGGADSQNIVDGDATWTRDYVYLKNTGATTAQATVIFLQ